MAHINHLMPHTQRFVLFLLVRRDKKSARGQHLGPHQHAAVHVVRGGGRPLPAPPDPEGHAVHHGRGGKSAERYE